MFLLPIRMTGGGLVDGVEIDPQPRWSVTLGYKNRAEWQPLLRPIVALNGYRYGVDGPVVTRDSVEVSMRVTLPLAEQERILQQIRGARTGSPTLNYGNFVFGFRKNSARADASRS
jgi:hypothetical protein